MTDQINRADARSQAGEGSGTTSQQDSSVTGVSGSSKSLGKRKAESQGMILTVRLIHSHIC